MMLIAVEGVTGIGKSTLQNILMSLYDSKSLVMDFEKHPYFDIPHLELSKYVLEREMIFLFMGYHLLKNTDVATNLIISDFIFDRFRVFGVAALSRTDLESIFYPCFYYLRSQLPRPDLIIRLVGSPTFVMSRIRRRNRDGEDYITVDYLASLDQAFNVLFREYQGYKTITINAEEYDFLSDQNAVERVTLLIESELPQLQGYRMG